MISSANGRAKRSERPISRPTPAAIPASTIAASAAERIERMQEQRAREGERAAVRGAGARARRVERARAAAVDGDQAHRPTSGSFSTSSPVTATANALRSLRSSSARTPASRPCVVERGHDPDQLVGARLEGQHEPHAVAAPDAPGRPSLLVEQLERVVRRA